MHHKIRFNKKLIIAICLIFAFAILIPIGYAYFFVTGEFEGSYYVHLPGFDPKINGNGIDEYQSIDLSDTITNGKSMAPGAVGKFNMNLNFSDVYTDAYYKIVFNRVDVPDNIHFYIDAELTKEIDYIEGVQLASNPNKIAENIIYWTWLYVDSVEANQNDSLYMKEEISFTANIHISQTFDEYDMVMVNEFQNPTGRISLNGNSGSFNMKLDFSRISGSTSYNVFFDKETVGDVHLYSDSEYHNEVTSLSGTFDGTNKVITTPLYWRCEGTCSSGGLYYIVYLS